MLDRFAQADDEVEGRRVGVSVNRIRRRRENRLESAEYKSACFAFSCLWRGVAWRGVAWRGVKRSVQFKQSAATMNA